MRRLRQEAPHRTVHLTATFRSGPAVEVTHKGERRAESDRRVGCGDCGHRPRGWPRWGLRSGSREGRTCRTEAHGRGVRCPQTAHHVQLRRRGDPPCPGLFYKTKAQTETAVLCALLEVRQPRDSFSFLVEEEKHEASRFPLQENTAPRGLCPTDTGAVGSARGWCPEPEPRVIRREARE